MGNNPGRKPRCSFPERAVAWVGMMTLLFTWQQLQALGTDLEKTDCRLTS